MAAISDNENGMCTQVIACEKAQRIIYAGCLDDSCASCLPPNLKTMILPTRTSTPTTCLKVNGTCSKPNQPRETHNNANPSCADKTTELAYVGPSSLIPCTRQMTTPTPIKPLNQYQGCIFSKTDSSAPSNSRPITSEAKNPMPNTSAVVAQDPARSFTLLLKIFCRLTSEPARTARYPSRYHTLSSPVIAPWMMIDRRPALLKPIAMCLFVNIIACQRSYPFLVRNQDVLFAAFDQTLRAKLPDDPVQMSVAGSD